MDSAPASSGTRLLRYREDRWNLLRATTALPIVLVPVVFGLPAGAAGVACGLTVWFCVNDANLVLHQHVHHPLTRSSTINVLLDWLLSLTTGMSAYAWRQHHLLRHHRGDDSWTHARAWEIARPSVAGALSYSARYGLLMLTLPLLEAFELGVRRRVRAPIHYPRAFVQQAVVVTVAMTLCVLAPAFYVPYYVLVFFFTALTDYQNHVGCSDAELDFANNLLRPLYNRVRDNFGYHTAHHCHPEAHWTRLPEIHEAIHDRIPRQRTSHGWWIGQLSVPVVVHGIAWLFDAFRRRTMPRETPHARAARQTRP